MGTMVPTAFWDHRAVLAVEQLCRNSGKVSPPEGPVAGRDPANQDAQQLN